MLNTRGTRLRAVVAAAILATLALSACGGDDFENEPRPPEPITVSGVITADRVTVSPNEFGAGPIVLTISNQTRQSHRVTLEGEGDDGTEVSEVTAPVAPEDTATIQQNLPEGDYRVTANSDSPVVSEIRPGRITVGPPRLSASDELQLQ